MLFIITNVNYHIKLLMNGCSKLKLMQHYHPTKSFGSSGQATAQPFQIYLYVCEDNVNRWRIGWSVIYNYLNHLSLVVLTLYDGYGKTDSCANGCERSWMTQCMNDGCMFLPKNMALFWCLIAAYFMWLMLNCNWDVCMSDFIDCKTKLLEFQSLRNGCEFQINRLLWIVTKVMHVSVWLWMWKKVI